MTLLTFCLIMGLISVHIFSKKLLFLNALPRHRFLSLSSGIAVSYVFVHLLPELNKYQKKLERSLENSFWGALENHIYLLALLGLVLFYGLELIVRRKTSGKTKKRDFSLRIFQLHMVSFFFYNSIIGYLLVKGEYEGKLGLVLFFIAMSVHFIANDWSLRTSHEVVYDRYGRWVLAFAILMGWGVATFVEVREVVISLLTAFLAGGIILNVMKEELPEKRNSSLSAFLLGVFSYTILLLFI